MLQNNLAHIISATNANPNLLLRSKRHYQFVAMVDDFEDCHRPYDYWENSTETCEFVTNTPNCIDIVTIFDYLKFFVCQLNMDYSKWGVVLSVLLSLVILIIYYVGLYVVGRYFLLPNSVALTQHFWLKDYEYGLIVLGSLFAMPDTLYKILSCSQYSRAALLHAESNGKIFITFIIGLCVICYWGSRRLNSMTIIRDLMFFTFGTFYVFFSISREMNNENIRPDEQDASTISILAYMAMFFYGAYLVNIVFYSERRKLPGTSDSDIPQRIEQVPSSSESIESDSYPDNKDNPIEYSLKPFQIFCDIINPCKNVKEKNIFWKVVVSPWYIFFALVIPVVNQERPLHGWCKFIYCLSFLIFPLYFSRDLVNVENMISVELLGCIASILIAVMTHSQRMPIIHDFSALWGLIFGFFLFDAFDNEINVLQWQMLRYLGHWDEDIILLLAFPLSYVFVVSVFAITLMSNGRRDMALGYVFGICIFATSISLLELTISVCFMKTHVYTISANATTTTYFLIINQIIILFALSLNGFELRRSLCIYFIIVYLVFAVFILLANFELVHPLGSMHSLDPLIEVLHTMWA